MKAPILSTPDQATPLVEEFVRRFAMTALGDHATIERFFKCDPFTNEVMALDTNEKWEEASWGAVILCESFSSEAVGLLSNPNKAIYVHAWDVRPAASYRVKATIWLSARVEYPPEPVAEG